MAVYIMSMIAEDTIRYEDTVAISQITSRTIAGVAQLA
jgi:hypothetical protein